ncbi:MAG: glycosyl hydrolase 43 family protein [Pseudobutyrivibrio sp.]|nr:glycosyl hydrolase 43 family protein [Pseudobutyrivibrio sp.]
MLYTADQCNGRFQNPILFADYSDPDVIRVDETYYMTASSFNYTPGLPILTSHDLVNWELKNYALNNIQYDDYKIPQHSKGVWAPSIRYHEGCFYIFYGMPDEGIFMVKSTDPLGKWNDPVQVLSGKGLIDPCPLWDDDGKAYIVHAYAKSRIGFKSHLGIFEINKEGTKAVSEDHILYNGLNTQPTIEGPKVYKREGYYYIMAPAGGVKTGWQTVLRSKNIHGPFEEKIVLRQKDTDVNGPHQGGWVDTVHGEDWFIHFQDKGLYGRICHLQPVNWVDGWPAMGVDADDDYCGKPMLYGNKPMTAIIDKPCYLEASDQFSKETLNLQWQWMGNHYNRFYSLTANPRAIRLYSLNPSNKEKPVLWEQANVLTQKLVCPHFECITSVNFAGLQENEQAGLVMMGGKYAYLAVRMVNGKKKLILAEAYEDVDGIRERFTEVIDIEDDINSLKLGLCLAEDKGLLTFDFYYYDMEDRKYKVDTDFFPSDHTWVGAKIGLFAHALDNREHAGYADFGYIRVMAYD